MAKTVKKKLPKFRDGKHRYQDENGWWRRLDDWCCVAGKLKEEWEPLTDELETDEIGVYYVANNEVRVYTEFK